MTPTEDISIRFLPHGPGNLRDALNELGVDPYGVRIMQPKGVLYLVRLGPVSYPAANILKQEMLSMGGECALPRNVVTGKVRRTHCLLIASASHLRKLRVKLRSQPFGLSQLSADLEQAAANYEKKGFTLKLPRTILTGSGRPLVMAIVNLTPDSFSGDGLAGRDPGWLLEHCTRLVSRGADILDIGGESSRPGAFRVPAGEELRRVIPAVRLLAKKLKVPVSVDTCKAEVARAAVDSGAQIINDITGLRDPAMARVCARGRCGVIIMHMRGTPATMKRLARYGSLMEELHGYFRRRMSQAEDAGIRPDHVVLDPGIGFAKNARQNLEILKNLSQFKTLGRPLLVGASRKSFIGILNKNAAPGERLPGSIAACTIAAANGVDILRVHDVPETVQALRTACAIFDA